MQRGYLLPTTHHDYVEAWPPAPPGYQTATDQIHAGTDQQLPAHPVRQPLYLSAAYEFSSLEQARETFAQRQPGFTYSQIGRASCREREQRAAGAANAKRNRRAKAQ